MLKLCSLLSASRCASIIGNIPEHYFLLGVLLPSSKDDSSNGTLLLSTNTTANVTTTILNSSVLPSIKVALLGELICVIKMITVLTA